MSVDSDQENKARRQLYVLAASVGAVATCGIVYQLVVGTVSTYLLGNSTVQFSVTIGLFMSAYGLGSFASTRVRRHLLSWFLGTEIALGLLGGVSSFVLFWLYGNSDLFEAGRIALILGMGTLIGLEIPLLLRISEEYRKDLRVTVGQIMGFDYIGALVGGVAFPLLLLPIWGLLGAAALVGALNAIIALALVWTFRVELGGRVKIFAAASIGVMTLLLLVAFNTREAERYLEAELYEDPVVYREQSPYQRLVVTRRGEDVRLYLDGSLQFATADEYRYHESLVHPAATRIESLKSVLILGGGDGFALRELAHYPQIERIVMVDLDPAMTNLGKEHPELLKANENAFERTKPEVLNEDAFLYLKDTAEAFDLIVVDLPDPHHESLAKLYSVTFYQALKRHLAKDGLVSLQLGSPFFANRTYWTSVRTLERAGFNVTPYHANVPSFGIWGFGLASVDPELPEPVRAHEGKFYSTLHDHELFRMPPDLMPRHETQVNTLVRPVIVEYFQRDWRGWN